ncbi:histidine phosphatase family protein [Marinomonas sp. 15G1-11]|uniref:Histidine phosphatase family protein n=1 Tax=Marinomonas phaeophyticola TaxID=3004091 RepID=A0ABT4JPI4_9GAMM|nr:histidine phosphatase family protein [Marinomonas sp. 15G1-11]MCZ2720275.1 histidine phosphatase family protein [Marinomonas sp. 15G1-11]
MTLIKAPFVFVRHAQSVYNKSGLIGGFTDSQLSEEGILQAQKASEILTGIEWSAVCTSSLKRTKETASYLVPDYPCHHYDGLKERNWGDLEGESILQQTPYELTPPNGESWLVFEARVIKALNTILSQYERPLIVAHSGVYRVLNNLINGTPYCPRVGNVTPIIFNPNQNGHGWSISPFKGKFK